MDSVSSQRGYSCELEHVVVDDGSSDDTAAIVDAYARTHPHVHVVHFDKNHGTNAGRNAAARAAKGDFVLLLDSDDVLLPDAVATIEAAVAAHPEMGYFMFAVSDRASVYDESERVFTFRDFLEGRVLGDFAHLIPRKVMLDNPFDESLRIYEGVFMLRFYREMGKMLFVNKVTHGIDRCRQDHVTFTLDKTSDTVLKRDCAANELLYSWFVDEYMATEKGRAALGRILAESYRNHVLLADYEAAETDAERMSRIGARPAALYRVVKGLHAGGLLWCLGRNAVKLKHAIRRSIK